MSDYNPTLEQLQGDCEDYIFGEQDFTGLPVVKLGPYPSPEDHPDNDPLRPIPPIQSDVEWAVEMAELHELVDRIETGVGWVVAHMDDSQASCNAFDYVTSEVVYAPVLPEFDEAGVLLSVWGGQDKAA